MTFNGKINFLHNDDVKSSIQFHSASICVRILLVDMYSTSILLGEPLFVLFFHALRCAGVESVMTNGR